jgi:hypothetical protein
MLKYIQHHSEPFEFFTGEEALPQDLLGQLANLFEEDLAWEHHHDSFYKAYLCEIGDRIPAAFHSLLVHRMSEITGLPLCEPIRATIQRMEPGQFAGPHTDRPLMGYEAVRLIVQLNEDWNTGHGGELHLHGDMEGKTTSHRRPPRFNTAFGFVMGPNSFHSVQPVKTERRTAVFNFWHQGNTPELARWVRAQLKDIRFEDLPKALEARAIEAETTHSEADSFRAGVMAHFLQQWRFNDAWVCRAYESGLSPVLDQSSALPVTLARWFHHLEFEDFCPHRWKEVHEIIKCSDWHDDPRIAEPIRLGFMRRP